jgi:hypothetical protein
MPRFFFLHIFCFIAYFRPERTPEREKRHRKAFLQETLLKAEIKKREADERPIKDGPGTAVQA